MDAAIRVAREGHDELPDSLLKVAGLCGRSAVEIMHSGLELGPNAGTLRQIRHCLIFMPSSAQYLGHQQIRLRVKWPVRQRLLRVGSCFVVLIHTEEASRRTQERCSIVGV